MALTLTIISALLALASANTKLIMNVTHHTDDNARLDWVTIRCSVEAGMDTLERLILSGSAANGTTDQLARIDSTSAQPIVAPEITEFQVRGSADQKFLSLLFKDPKYQYRHSYRCVASGIDAGAEQVLLSDIQYFRVQLNYNKIDFDLTKYHVSDVYVDRVYLASRDETTFNLSIVNTECVHNGGYLVELNSQAETTFVLNFAEKISGLYMTGGNDVDVPNRFVYYNSKLPVPDYAWLPNQPDNTGGNEQCARIEGRGLNDIRCTMSTKYMCEIPLRQPEQSTNISPQ